MSIYNHTHIHIQKERAADRQKTGRNSLQTHLFVSTRDKLSVLYSVAVMKHLFSVPNKAYIFGHEVTGICASSKTEPIRM